MLLASLATARVGGHTAKWRASELNVAGPRQDDGHSRAAAQSVDAGGSSAGGATQAEAHLRAGPRGEPALPKKKNGAVVFYFSAAPRA